jgi:hypothetical protein
VTCAKLLTTVSSFNGGGGGGESMVRVRECDLRRSVSAKLRAHIVGAERLGRCAPRVGASVREEERTYEEDRRYALDEPNQIWSFASEFMSAKSEDTLFD